MGIYVDDAIYGIRIYNFDENDELNTLYEKKYDTVMNHDQMTNAYLFYMELLNKSTPNMNLQYYTKCWDTYSESTHFGWWPMTLEQLKKIE